jgi:alpha-galactosidase
MSKPRRASSRCRWSAQPDGTRIGISGDTQQALAPGATLDAADDLCDGASRATHFRPLDAYRRIMAERGLAAPAIPGSSYGPIWCAWGYERNFTTAQVYGTLPKAKALGFEWAVLDDGWQTSEGTGRSIAPNSRAAMPT